MAETIKLETHIALQEALRDFRGGDPGETNHKLIQGSSLFVKNNIGLNNLANTTLIIAHDDGKVSVLAKRGGETVLFMNTDTAIGDAPASVVKPGLYNEQREPDRNGQFMRPIIRMLTDEEGKGLTRDLQDQSNDISRRF